MSSLVRRALLTASAVALAGSAAGLVVGATALPQASTPATRDTTATVQVTAGDTVLVCPSAPQLADTGVDTDSEFAEGDIDATAAQSIWSFPRSGTTGVGVVALGPAADAATEPLTETGSDGAAVFTGSYLSSVATLSAAGDASALAAGGAVWELTHGDLRGLDAASCVTPGTDFWLVGGSTTLGTSALLEVVNPGTTPATVDISIFTELGPVDSAIPAQLTLAAGESTEFRVEAAAAEVARLALHVTATGGQVAAFLHVNTLDALTPMGVTTVQPTASPTTTQLVPGVRLVASDDDAETADVEPADSDNTVRIVNPGEESATASVTLLGPDGAIELPGAQDVTIDPGAVYDFSLAAIGPGDYTVQVEADQALAVGVMLDRAGAVDEDLGMAPHDVAWLPAVTPTESGAVAVPEVAESGTLVLAAQDDVVVEVTTWDADGTASAREVTIAAGSTVTIQAGAAATLEADGPVVGAVLVESQDGALVDALPVTRDANTSHAIEMQLRN